MQITILNGNPDAANAGFEAYLRQLTGALEGAHQATLLPLRELNIAYCTGCWAAG